MRNTFHSLFCVPYGGYSAFNLIYTSIKKAPAVFIFTSP